MRKEFKSRSIDCSSGLSPCMNFGSANAACCAAGPMVCKIPRWRLIACLRSGGIACHFGSKVVRRYCRLRGRHPIEDFRALPNRVALFRRQTIPILEDFSGFAPAAPEVSFETADCFAGIAPAVPAAFLSNSPPTWAVDQPSRASWAVRLDSLSARVQNRFADWSSASRPRTAIAAACAIAPRQAAPQALSGAAAPSRKQAGPVSTMFLHVHRAQSRSIAASIIRLVNPLFFRRLRHRGTQFRQRIQFRQHLVIIENRQILNLLELLGFVRGRRGR